MSSWRVRHAVAHLLARDATDHDVERAQHGRQPRERVAHELGGRRRERREWGREQTDFEPRRQRVDPQDIGSHPVRLATRRARRPWSGWRARRRPDEPLCEQRLAPRVVWLFEDFLDQQVSLANRQTAADYHRARRLLVATWQPAHRHRRPRGDEPQADVGLDAWIK
jgi:hypothetical protein